MTLRLILETLMYYIIYLIDTRYLFLLHHLHINLSFFIPIKIKAQIIGGTIKTVKVAPLLLQVLMLYTNFDS